MISIRKYSEEDRRAWDDFVRQSKNGTFLFFRDYMEYHSDRFTDASLLFFRKDELVGLMPSCINDDTYSSHAGLTYGGIVTDNRMRVPIMLEVFESLISFLRVHDYNRLVYKAIPFIYHSAPAQEDLYALFLHNARLIRRDVSSTLYMRERIPLNELRRRTLKKARRHDLTVKQSFDFSTYMGLVGSALAEKYNARPTHTAKEMEMLANRFPGNIKLYAAFHGQVMHAGMIVYETPLVVHAQYIAATDAGKEVGALDLLIDHLLNNCYTEKRYFEFGTSMEPDGSRLNPGVLTYKESFGARTTVYDFYEVNLQ
jgi:hypothetical protein